MNLGVAMGAQVGLGRAFAVRAEARVVSGAPGLSIVGLADKAVGEARERVAAALETSGILSIGSRAAKVTVSLSPADQKKSGSHLDLTIAAACLSAAGVTPSRQGVLTLGELSLDGSLLPCRGVLAMVEAARRDGASSAIVPAENAREAAAVPGIEIFGAASLREAAGHLSGKRPLQPFSVSGGESIPENEDPPGENFHAVSTSQPAAVRAAEIAVAGGHSFAMIGPPGSGKTTVAKACAEMLPALSDEEAVDVARTQSLAGIPVGFPVKRPFRAPHHTATYAALVGGGQDLRPGEAALAHRGVLFLDELPEFDRRALDALREPVEDGCVRVSRAAGSVVFPARFSLIAAMNPCPCGFAGDSGRECRCPPGVAARYLSKISGPLVDRIDIWARVLAPATEDVISGRGSAADFAATRSRVTGARLAQERRARSLGLPPWATNAELPDRVLKQDFSGEAVRSTLAAAATRLGLSARGITRTMRVARTIADLAGEEKILPAHALEAVGYRDKRS